MTDETQQGKSPLAATTTVPANTSRTADAKPDLNGEIKKTWSRLTDDEVKLHAEQPDQFFAAVKTKYGTDKEEAKKRLTEIKTSCGACSSDKAA